MLYNEPLAGHIRKKLESLTSVNEKKMLGRISFLVNGNMALEFVRTLPPK